MRNYSLKAKLSLLIISISSVLLIVGMFISYRETKSGLIKEAELAKEAILEETSMKLESIRDNKKSTIEAYFNTIKSDVCQKSSRGGCGGRIQEEFWRIP